MPHTVSVCNTLEKPVSEVERARLYSTAAGNQTMYMNGQRASDERCLISMILKALNMML